MEKPKGNLILSGAALFDSLTGELKAGVTIVIDGNRILRADANGAYAAKAEDTVLNLEGKTVLPGMIDCHVHLQLNRSPDHEREYLRSTDGMWYYRALKNAQSHLRAGFTCLRDCGSEFDWAPSLRRIFDEGVLPGPRLVVAGHGIAQWGNQEALGPKVLNDSTQFFPEIPAGTDSVRQAVRDRKRSGSDFIKTLATGGVLHGAHSKLGASLFTEEELAAMVEEAHRLGMRVAVHAHGREGVFQAVKAGIDTIEHGSFIDEEIAGLMVEKGLYLVLTQNAIRGLMKPEIFSGMPPEVREKIKNVFAAKVENYRMAFGKGVFIALGTDAGTPGNPHGRSANEMLHLIESVGMTPAQALQTATIASARAIGMDHLIGSIEPGKLADLVVCDGNPVEDFSRLTDFKNLLHVIKDGKVLSEQGRLF